MEWDSTVELRGNQPQRALYCFEPLPHTITRRVPYLSNPRALPQDRAAVYPRYPVPKSA
jgi:hypothetical protein